MLLHSQRIEIEFVKLIMRINTLHTIDTKQPADCLEWCTHPDYPHHFICGTYHLEEGETDFSQAPTSTLFQIIKIKSQM